MIEALNAEVANAMPVMSATSDSSCGELSEAKHL